MIAVAMANTERPAPDLIKACRENGGTKLFSALVGEEDLARAREFGIPYAVHEFLANCGIVVGCSDEMYEAFSGKEDKGLLVVCRHKHGLDVYALIAALGACQQRWQEEGNLCEPGKIARREFSATVIPYGASDFMFAFSNSQGFPQEGFVFDFLAGKSHTLDRRSLQMIEKVRNNGYFPLYYLLDGKTILPPGVARRVNGETMNRAASLLASPSSALSIFADGSYIKCKENEINGEVEWKPGIIRIISQRLSHGADDDLVILPWQADFPYGLSSFMKAIAFPSGEERVISQSVGALFSLEEALGEEYELFSYHQRLGSVEEAENIGQVGFSGEEEFRLLYLLGFDYPSDCYDDPASKQRRLRRAIERRLLKKLEARWRESFAKKNPEECKSISSGFNRLSHRL